MTSYEIVRSTSLYNTIMHIVIDKYSKNERDIFINGNNIAFTIDLCFKRSTNKSIIDIIQILKIKHFDNSNN